MSSYIRCPECSRCIGKYANFIEKAKQAIYNEEVFGENKAYANYDPEKMCFSPNISPSLEHLFDAVGIINRCCRMHIVTKTHFDRMYK